MYDKSPWYTAHGALYSNPSLLINPNTKQSNYLSPAKFNVRVINLPISSRKEFITQRKTAAVPWSVTLCNVSPFNLYVQQALLEVVATFRDIFLVLMIILQGPCIIIKKNIHTNSYHYSVVWLFKTIPTRTQALQNTNLSENMSRRFTAQPAVPALLGGW